MTLLLTVKATPKFPDQITFGYICSLAEQSPGNAFNLKKLKFI